MGLERRRLVEIDLDPLFDRALPVVITLHKRRAVDVAHLRSRRRMVLDVINVSRLAAHSAAREPPHQNFAPNAYFYHHLYSRASLPPPFRSSRRPAPTSPCRDTSWPTGPARRRPARAGGTGRRSKSWESRASQSH